MPKNENPVENSNGPTARKLWMSLSPLSPAPLTGSDAVYGWARLALYGGLTYATWKRTKKTRYVFAGLTAVSLGTSISTGAWNNG